MSVTITLVLSTTALVVSRLHQKATWFFRVMRKNKPRTALVLTGTSALLYYCTLLYKFMLYGLRVYLGIKLNSYKRGNETISTWNLFPFHVLSLAVKDLHCEEGFTHSWSKATVNTMSNAFPFFLWNPNQPPIIYSDSKYSFVGLKYTSRFFHIGHMVLWSSLPITLRNMPYRQSFLGFLTHEQTKYPLG